MSFNSKRLAFAAVAVSIALMSAPVQAQNFSSIDSLLNSSWGRNGAEIAPNQAQIQAELASRSSQLEAQIIAGERSGQIAATESGSLRTELSAINVAVNNGPLTVGQVRTTMTKIRDLESSIQRSTRIRDGFNDGDSRSRWGRNGSDVAPNQTQLKAELTNHSTQLAAQITAGEQSGQLTTTESGALRTELSAINVAINNGALTRDQSRQAFDNVRQLQAHIQRDLHNREVSTPGGSSADFTGRIVELRTRMSAAVASRRLSNREARQLTSQINQTEAQYNQFATNGINRRERNQLDNSIRMIARRLDAMTRY